MKDNNLNFKNEKIKNILGIAFIAALAAGIYSLNLAAQKKDDFKAIEQHTEKMNAYEKMAADVRRDARIEDDIIARALTAHRADTANNPAPPPPTERKEEVSSDEIPCRASDILLGRNDCQPPPTNTSTGSNSSSNNPPSGQLVAQNTQTPRHPLLMWRDIQNNAPETIRGRQTHYHGPVVRAGCRLLAVIEDELIIPTNYEHHLVVNVRGALNDCQMPNVEGIRLVGKAKLAPGERYVIASVDRCSDSNPNRKSVDCQGKAVIKSITGADMLEGDLYDEAGWSIFWESVLAVGMTPAIAKLTQTAASAETIFTAATAGSIASTLTQALNRISQKISAVFDGKEIRIPDNSTVVIVFTDDVVL